MLRDMKRVNELKARLRPDRSEAKLINQAGSRE
jgi:hypothetical protein